MITHEAIFFTPSRLKFCKNGVATNAQRCAYQMQNLGGGGGGECISAIGEKDILPKIIKIENSTSSVF